MNNRWRMWRMNDMPNHPTRAIMLAAIIATPPPAAPVVPDPATMPEITAHCLDFNWQGSGRWKQIADPGFMMDADAFVAPKHPSAFRLTFQSRGHNHSSLRIF